MSYNVILTNDGEIDGFSLLNEKGIKTFHYPMIKISALNSDVSFSLDDYDFFIFTSKNGVKFFFEKDTVKSQNKTSIKCISIGSKTNKTLHEYNIEPIYSAKRSYSSDLYKDLKNIKLLNSKKVMLIQGNLAKNYLFENLKMICYLTKFVPYKTEIIKELNKNLETLLKKEKTYTVFTSPSGFLSFENLYDVNKTSIISIGETTSSFIKERGYEPLVTSQMQSYEGIAETIISNLKIN
tara:strand:+ start:274 stop:987 length:714 start_codon:yes stop_codon:yes gene_type:complete